MMSIVLRPPKLKRGLVSPFELILAAFSIILVLAPVLSFLFEMQMDWPLFGRVSAATLAIWCGQSIGRMT